MSTDTGNSGSHPLAALTTSHAHDNVDDAQKSFLDILNVLVQYHVPSVDLESVGAVRLGSLKPGLDGEHVRYGYNLGAGYSARVIQHTTSNDVFDVTGKNPIVEAGTVVALKQIATRPLQNGEDETTAISEAYHSAWQEIKICCHPFLRHHENICRLLYVGWERRKGFPSIALELAAFGTLEDVLTAPGEGPTYKQKTESHGRYSHWCCGAPSRQHRS
jgi:hypothetical protein